MKSEIDATIVTQCRIEKKNYAFKIGFTLDNTTSGGDISFLLDSIALCELL